MPQPEVKPVEGKSVSSPGASAKYTYLAYGEDTPRSTLAAERSTTAVKADATKKTSP
jgi:hypothetical protein